VFRGEVPASEYSRMRAPYQAGDFPGPVKYGYANVGEIEAGPPGWRGRRVFCLYPHQARYVVPAAAVVPLPDGVTAERAVLAANTETAVNALWDGAPRIGDRIAVVGGGTLGCLVAWLAARIPGCSVQLVDPNPARARVARALGADYSRPETAREDNDLVFHASGAAAGASTALRLAGFEATVLELSWFGASPVTLPLGEGFHARRLTLRASQVGHVATAQRARWTHRRRLETALALLADPVVDVLITGEDPFANLPGVMARLAHAPGDTLCHRIRYA
jgi:threonine dehydrogenase-like Zn-dependent dehydrogenase